jgi:hypothetical protein
MLCPFMPRKENLWGSAKDIHRQIIGKLANAELLCSTT